MNKFSLIVPTLGRTKELELFLKSIENQIYKNFQVIIVDQNDHNLVKDICDKYINNFELIYIKSNEKGLSLNRNKGIKIADGNIIAFPDDDCEYDENTLFLVNKYFKTTNYNIYSCKVIDKYNKKPFGKSQNFDCDIKYSNIMKNCVSISIFIKYKEKNHIHFDEKLGVGAKFGSGEESDLIFSLYHKGYRGKYFAREYIYHPFKLNDDNRVKSDSLGLGALMKKEIIYRGNIVKILFYINRLIRPTIGYLIKPNRRSYFKQAIKYRIQGFIDYRKD